MARNEINKDLICNLTVKAEKPVVFRQFILEWPFCKWDEEKWISVFGEKEIPFRCCKKNLLSNEPCWERQCQIKNTTFKRFIESITSKNEWMYFDYKYLHQWFKSDNEIFTKLSWEKFGYPEKGPSDTTLWVGSEGAHTPAHQDTYGFNVVAQVHGKKRWILFPPETPGLRPTRVPYEESSVYSELNFYCPSEISDFNGLSGGYMVELCAGDALFVPKGWWHYVQNLDPLNISFNIWIPHEKDKSTLVSEALIKIFVAQICKDLPQETAKLLINPNEDDLSDTPLAVLFLQLETVAKAYLDHKRRTRRCKRQRTEEDTATNSLDEFDINTILDDKNNSIEYVPKISNFDLIRLLENNVKEYTSDIGTTDEADGVTSSLCLTKALIDSFSQSNVIDIVKQNLFSRLGDM
ncbi:HSPB1-associated protein 1 [Aricia agestis]|uniref:HSPB1-associated protein 1 n=1 Tax=Aricia agestis TaxID=91739 RepID=UPI001C208E7A|nr:HSPB1-associated protein 1 [Aricia agestis]